MKRVYFILLFINFLYAEPSVYSDADFIDPTVLAKKNSREIFILKEKISALKEQIEGLKSIIRGQSNEIAALKEKINSSNLEDIINQLSQRIAKLESRPAQIVKVEKEIPKKSTLPKAKTKISSKSNEELYKEAILDITKNKLSSAKSILERLLKKGYKKASVNFYLGEIAYKQKRYTNAIEYYQQSAVLNENAAYMNKLLLHTAIALYKKGKKKEAMPFFKTVIDDNPDSALAKEARKYLK